MIIIEIILSLIVGMWMVSLIILPTNKLTKLNNNTEIDMKKNMNISKAQQSLYNTTNSEFGIDFRNIDDDIYDTSSEKHKKVSEEKAYINIRDEKSYYLKDKDEKKKIFKSRKWIPGDKTMESIAFSKNQLEIELKRYLKNIEEKTGTLGIEDIKNELKIEDQDNKEKIRYSFSNPISKIDIDEEDRTIGYVSFVKIIEIIKEIDRWKVYYVVSEGNIELNYINGSINLEKEYEVDGDEKNFILEIPIDKSRGS